MTERLRSVKREEFAENCMPLRHYPCHMQVPCRSRAEVNTVDLESKRRMATLLQSFRVSGVAFPRHFSLEPTVAFTATLLKRN